MQLKLTLTKEELRSIAACHLACFPSSLAGRLGLSYVQQTFDWFLASPNRFLFYVENKGSIVGYCGGFIPQKRGDGSSSGMLQHAFSHAVRGVLRRPWLLFHPEVLAHYPFVWLNIRRRVSGKTIPASTGQPKPFAPYAGLVVIGVMPAFRGVGLAQQLLQHFEDTALARGQQELVLSVKKTNEPAIKAYIKHGWNIKEAYEKTLVMSKLAEVRKQVLVTGI